MGLLPPAPKAGASTNSATPAHFYSTNIFALRLLLLLFGVKQDLFRILASLIAVMLGFVLGVGPA